MEIDYKSHIKHLEKQLIEGERQLKDKQKELLELSKEIDRLNDEIGEMEGKIKEINERILFATNSMNYGEDFARDIRKVLRNQ